MPEKSLKKLEKRFDIIVYTWYTTTVNKEEVPLLTLWHEQIGLIQYSNRVKLCFSVCGGFFRRFSFCKALVDTVYLGGA